MKESSGKEKIRKNLFKRYYQLASKWLKSENSSDGNRISKLLKRAQNKISTGGFTAMKEKGGEQVEKLKILMRMLKAHISGRYRKVPWNTLVKALAVIIYFVTPLDAIPDFIPITGFIDDFTVLFWVWSSIESDLQLFLQWEESIEGSDLSQEVK